MQYRPLTLWLFLSLGFLATAQELDSIPKRILFTEAITSTAPQIDGDLSDACWEQVGWSGDYQQFEPYNREAPSQDTKLKVLYDAKNLYVAYRCYDTEPAKIERRMSRRDGFPGDWIEINIDSYHDLRSAFSFTISASGVKGDEFISNDGNNWDANWNPIWYAKTRVDDEGWTAEIRIPLSQLRFGEAEEYQVDDNDDRAFDYSFGNPDFNFIQFRSNLVLRWEYVPGSELFLVWSQGANASSDPSRGLTRSLSENLFGDNATNVLLVKATYRFLR